MALFLRPSRRSYYNDPWGWDDDMDFLLPTVMNLPRLVSAVRRPCAGSQEGNNQLGVKYDKDKFQVMLDVQQFKPEELNVKVVDNYLVVEAKHEEKPDEHGYISRQFTRRYLLPEDVNGEAVKCDLSSDGVLMVSAPRVLKELKSNERAVPITQIETPAITKKQEQQMEQSQPKTAETQG